MKKWVHTHQVNTDYSHDIVEIGPNQHQGRTVARLGQQKDPNGELAKDARLIAAAPELLEACKIAILALTHEPIHPKDIEFIKKAIKKAE